MTSLNVAETSKSGVYAAICSKRVRILSLILIYLSVCLETDLCVCVSGTWRQSAVGASLQAGHVGHFTKLLYSDTGAAPARTGQLTRIYVASPDRPHGGFLCMSGSFVCLCFFFLSQLCMLSFLVIYASLFVACMCTVHYVWLLKCAEGGVVCHCASISLPVTAVGRAKGKEEEEEEKEWERRRGNDSGSRERNSAALLEDVLELETLFIYLFIYLADACLCSRLLH